MTDSIVKDEMLKLLLLLAAGVMPSKYIASDFPLTADPSSPAWKDAGVVFAENGPKGEAAPGYRTEIRSRWSDRNLYFLFICPYKTLFLKPNPTATEETNKLWDWDVAEVFVGTDFQNINLYKEFEVSPQGEWVDLDIDHGHAHPEGGWRWNSGFASKTRIDSENKVWYAEMRIPIDKIDTRRPEPGREMRLNLYRIEGAAPNRVHIAWQPTGQPTFHVPEAFGRLKLVK